MDPALNAIVQAIIKFGPFGVGTLFGATVMHFAHKVAAPAKADADRLRLQREENLNRQIAQKEDRIAELHRMLHEYQKKAATA